MRFGFSHPRDVPDKDRPTVPYIIVELKKPKLTDGKEQLKSYCNATGAPIGVWTNGEQVSCYNRKDPNFFEMISDIPKATQKLSDILSEKYTYDDLRTRDKISKEKRSLRNLIKEMEDEVLASAGVDSFEENCDKASEISKDFTLSLLSEIKKHYT